MKRKILCPLLLLLLAPLLTTETATASIQHFAWINSSVGEDLYYHQNVVAYKTGTWWNISISVYNDYLTPPTPRIYLPVNVTAIKVYFDWGAWFNYTFDTPVRMEPLEVKIFNVGNVTPPLTDAPEIWVHSYTVYVEYVVEGDTAPLMDWYWRGDNFAVMSETHFDTFQLYNKLKSIMTGGIPMLPSIINATEAQVLFVKAYTEYTLGRQYYTNGDFENAKTYFQNADLHINEALAAWNDRGTAFEDTMLEYYDSLAKAQIIQGNAALNNSYGWIFFGIGWILIGVGIIVYGARKPKAP